MTPGQRSLCADRVGWVEPMPGRPSLVERLRAVLSGRWRIVVRTPEPAPLKGVEARQIAASGEYPMMTDDDVTTAGPGLVAEPTR